jgi:hypothetical protein
VSVPYSMEIKRKDLGLCDRSFGLTINPGIESLFPELILLIE